MAQINIFSSMNFLPGLSTLRTAKGSIRDWATHVVQDSLHRLLHPRKKFAGDHDTVRFLFLAWVGCIGMPLYYVLWTVYFPQEFESVQLRACGLALCILSVCSRRMFHGRFLRAFDFAAITYMLPFFFCYMFLMNHGSPAWSQSLIVALIVLFHFESLWAFKSFFCGAASAGILFSMNGDPAFLTSNAALQQIPIMCFTVLVVSCAKVGRKVIEAEKLAGMAQALATVSHEIRTPLISVTANVRGVERRLLSRSFQDKPDVVAIGEAMSRIQFEVRHMNHMVDLFLMSSTAMNQKLEPCEEVSMCAVVESVISRYPFADQSQQDLVTTKVRADFVFFGKHELCVVLVLNLLRNALKALQRAGKGRVRIIIDGRRDRPRLMIVDTGCGIAAKQLPLIFDKFYTYPPSAGSGIGLALCKDISTAWNARIRCFSRESFYTLFVLDFPSRAIRSPRAQASPITGVNSRALTNLSTPKPDCPG